ncbi:MAG TPA: hypothetical protein VF595_13985 [Tepidisphaeraceae bacterium]|jgi:hypothetical protein
MPLTIGLSVDTLYYLRGAGHLWAYLNWALGLKELGHRVLWIESAVNTDPAEKTQALVDTLRAILAPWGLADSVALAPREDGPSDFSAIRGVLSGDDISGDLLIALQYCTRNDVLRKFRTSAMIDIDPGLTQTWVAQGVMTFSPYTKFFTIGEGVVRAGGKIPSVGKTWTHTPPAVALQAWPVIAADADAPFTTISHWYAHEWIVLDNGETLCNDKRSGFQPFLGLAARTKVPLELAIRLGDDAYEKGVLENLNWRVRESHDVTGDVAGYQNYIRSSRGEFSCAKPMYVRLDSGWISDRTICYLASGKPCLVQHTGDSDYLPDKAGLFRFKTEDDAVRGMEAIVADYPRQCRLARELAETHFDAAKVARRVIELTLS